jgi:ABC-type dipeptide/oligopeptide/nickel transport system permease component
MVLTMGLRAYIIKRIIYTVFLLIFVLTLNFIIFEVMPHNPLQFFIAAPKGGHGQLSDAQIATIYHQWGLDEPWYTKYVKYIWNMLTFNFGVSAPSTGWQPVVNIIMTYLPNTLLLMGTSTILSIIIGVVLGVLAAYKRGGMFDSAAVIISLITFSLPTFWMGLLAITVFAVNLHILPAGLIVGNGMPPWNLFSLFGTQLWFPTMTEVLSRISHMILPVAVLTLFSYGNYLLLTRATMLETLTEDYILTAKAKGLKERTIIFKHALKNASLPIITSSALAIGFLIGGAIITETVFSYFGIGWLTINSILITNDYPVLMAVFYITALTVIMANFIADLLYGVIDPRIKYG